MVGRFMAAMIWGSTGFGPRFAILVHLPKSEPNKNSPKMHCHPLSFLQVQIPNTLPFLQGTFGLSFIFSSRCRHFTSPPPHHEAFFLPGSHLLVLPVELCYKTPHRSVRGPAAVFRCLKRICSDEVSQLFVGETFLALQYFGLFVPVYMLKV